LFLMLGLITQKFSETRLRWKHSLFSLGDSARRDGSDHTARQAMAPLPAGLPIARKAASRYGFRDLTPLVSRDPLENLDEERADRW
jgi:hypothetical protein